MVVAARSAPMSQAGDEPSEPGDSLPVPGKGLLGTLAFDGVAANVLRCLDCADIAACLCTCCELRSMVAEFADWQALCKEMWADKVFVPARALKLQMSARTARQAFYFALQDAARTVIALEELTSMIWQTRIKEAVGQAEVLIDPFHCGQHCVYVCYNADGTIDREGFAEHGCEQLSPRPWPATHPLPHGQIRRGWGTWTFPERCGAVLTGPKGSFLRGGPAGGAVCSPTRAFIRHPKQLYVLITACRTV